jgi:hypothetical protein
MRRLADVALGLVAAGFIVGIVAGEAAKRVRRWV